jgi:hypothetical protein
MLSVIVLDLALEEVLSSVPTDPGAIIAYVLIAAFLWFIWKGSRPARPTGVPAAEAEDSGGTSGEKGRGEAAARRD